MKKTRLLLVAAVLSACSSTPAEAPGPADSFTVDTAGDQAPGDQDPGDAGDLSSDVGTLDADADRASDTHPDDPIHEQTPDERVETDAQEDRAEGDRRAEVDVGDSGRDDAIDVVEPDASDTREDETGLDDAELSEVSDIEPDEMVPTDADLDETTTPDADLTEDADLMVDDELREDVDLIADADLVEEVDLPPIVVGLDERPANLTCHPAGRVPQTGAIRLERVFSLVDLTLPIALLQAPSGDTDWYAVEKRGTVIRFQDEEGGGTPSVFIDFEELVYDGAGEMGLLGMAFHPDYESDGRIFLSYNVIDEDDVRYSVLGEVDTNEARTVVTSTEPRELLRVLQRWGNHNGGAIHFGPDGYLYMGLGDEGRSNDYYRNGQDPNTLHATILRLDVDDTGDEPYLIPPDNPFVDGGGRPEIFAWGLRNPWQFSFDSETGDLWVADVGQNKFEEIDVVVNGGNYGWPIFEGNSCYLGSEAECDNEDLLPPVLDYPHGFDTLEGDSVTGGYVYRGTVLPHLVGDYVFGDFSRGRIFAYGIDEVTGESFFSELADESLGLSTFGQRRDGELFAVDLYSGRIYQLVPPEEPEEASGPFQWLSETGCVLGDDPTEPAAGLIPYELNVPFWSDGADKARWLALPDGTELEVDGLEIHFPIGSVLMKTFWLDGRRIETRLLVRHDDGGWAGYPYVWNAEQSDAELALDGALVAVGDAEWAVPNSRQCLTCHTTAAGRTLGPEVLQLNRDFTYSRTGRTANQLVTLARIGIADEEPAPDAPALVPIGEGSLDEQARSYLHANCSNCHRPGGPGRGDLDFRYTAPELGACAQPPLGTDLGIEGAQLIRPGDPERSLVWLRLARRDDNQMPPLASDVVDEEGSELLRQWIESLETCP